MKDVSFLRISHEEIRYGARPVPPVRCNDTTYSQKDERSCGYGPLSWIIFSYFSMRPFMVNWYFGSMLVSHVFVRLKAKDVHALYYCNGPYRRTDRKRKKECPVKKYLSPILTFLLVCLLTLPAFSYSGWQPEVNSIDALAELVAEFRSIYELAVANRAASSDFLSDLEDLILRFEVLVVPETVPQMSTRIWSQPVEVLGGITTMTESCSNVGTVYYVVLEGSTGDRVWGDGVYTYDSDLSAAAVHAGVLAVDQSDIVAVRVLPGQSEYKGSTRNGITTGSWGAYDGSYEFVDYDKSTLLIRAADLYYFQGLIGRTFAFQVTGSIDDTVWGTDIYTYDSNLNTAAVHAGLVKNGETAVVLVDILGGQAEYLAKERNGVSSRSWGAYNLSYRLRNP